MHRAVAKKLLKRLGLDTEQFLKDAKSYADAEFLINEAIRTRDKLFHPDMKRRKSDDDFNEWQHIKNEILEYKSATIYEALKSKKQAEFQEAKVVPAADTRIKKLAARFVLGTYQENLKEKLSHTYLLIRTPHTIYGTVDIDIHSEDLDMQILAARAERSAQITAERISLLEEKLDEMSLRDEEGEKRAAELQEYHEQLAQVATDIAMSKNFGHIAQTTVTFYRRIRGKFTGNLVNILEKFDELETRRENIEDKEEKKELRAALARANEELKGELPTGLRREYITARMLLRHTGLNKTDYAKLATEPVDAAIRRATRLLEKKYTHENATVPGKRRGEKVHIVDFPHCRKYFHEYVEDRLKAAVEKIEELTQSKISRGSRRDELKQELHLLGAGKAMLVPDTNHDAIVNEYVDGLPPLLQHAFLHHKGTRVAPKVLLYVDANLGISSYKFTGAEKAIPSLEEFTPTSRRIVAVADHLNMHIDPRFLLPGAVLKGDDRVYPGHVLVDQGWYERFADDPTPGLQILSVDRHLYRIEGSLLKAPIKNLDQIL